MRDDLAAVARGAACGGRRTGVVELRTEAARLGGLDEGVPSRHERAGEEHRNGEGGND
jgi:hypothetical protein